MKTQWIIVAALGWAFAGAAAVGLISGCGKSGGATIATVNGDKITEEDFMNYLKTKDRIRVVTQSGVAEARVADTLAYQALEDLVLRRVVLQLAKDEGVEPTDAEVLAEIEFRKKLNPSFVTQLTSNGMTLDRIKEQLKIDLATERLLTKGITVGESEVDKFIKDNKLDVSPATADLVWVFVTSEAKKTEVENQLRSGQNFSTVARSLSEARDVADTNARYGIRVVSQMPQQLQDVVSKTNESSTTDWISGDGGWAKFFVEKKTAEKKEAVTPEKKEYWKRELAKNQGSKAKDLGKRLADYLFGSTVNVEPKDLKGQWEKAFERAKRDRKIDIPAATGSTENTN